MKKLHLQKTNFKSPKNFGQYPDNDLLGFQYQNRAILEDLIL